MMNETEIANRLKEYDDAFDFYMERGRMPDNILQEDLLENLNLLEDRREFLQERHIALSMNLLLLLMKRHLTECLQSLQRKIILM